MRPIKASPVFAFDIDHDFIIKEIIVTYEDREENQSQASIGIFTRFWEKLPTREQKEIMRLLAEDKDQGEFLFLRLTGI